MLKNLERESEPGRPSFNGDETSPPFAQRAVPDALQFRELMTQLKQVFWIEDSTDRLIRYVSPAYETIWGRTCKSLIENAPRFAGSIHPDDRERMDNAIAGKRAADGYDEEFRILRPDGEVRWVRARSYPVRDEQGVVMRFAGIADDITEQKAAEKERSRLAAIIEYADDSVVSVTPEGIIVGWNQGAERQYGYTAEEIMGCSLSILFPPGQYTEYLQVIARIRSGKPVEPYEAVRKRKDGTLTNVSIRIVPIEARDGEITGASKVSHDIARIKNLEAQIIESQKMELVGKLASGIAHDFNNILAVIMSTAEVMLWKLGEGHPMQKHVEEVKRATVRAGGLTRQLLLFSRKQSVQRVALDLNNTVSGMIAFMSSLVGEHIQLSVVADAPVAAVQADAGYIGQLLMNLVVNARDAMPDGGNLSVETRNVTVTAADVESHPGVPAGDYVVLRVRDSSVGMTDEVRSHIFDAFYTTKQQGTGLGLSTCRTIIEQSQAHITVSSELGAGATFQVYFPLAGDVPDMLARPRPVESLPTGTGLVLVVEDEPAVREVACMLLETLGYDVLQAANGQAALRVVRDYSGPPVRLVFTDVAMPHMSGPVMAEWLKVSFPDVKVLFTSGYMDNAALERDMVDASTSFLQKPYTLAALAAKVDGLLNLSN